MGDKLRYVGVALVAGTVGAMVALLMAPQSGRETRRQIRKRYDREREQLAKSGRRMMEDAGEFVHESLENGRKAVREVGEKVGEKVADGLDSGKRKVSRIVGA